MRINSPYITGSAIITGNLCVQGTITGTITGVASTASYAETLDGLDSTQFVQTGSFNSYTSSASSSLGDLSGSVATTTNTLSSSVSSSIGSLSGSVATTTSNLSSSIGSLSGSVATTTSGLSSSIGDLSSSVATTTSGLGGRITTIEGRYATTGSNTFVGSQVITGSLYITTDLIVQGSSSLQNITASAVSIGTNTVILNTDTPAVRFAGISVQDSGSNAGVTGSIFWDGLCNRWVYSNPATIGYSGGMLLSGPRTSTLGSESPLTCNYIAKSGGGDHLYDSCIIDDGTTVCVNATLKASGQVCGVMGTFSCVGIGTSTPQSNLQVLGTIKVATGNAQGILGLGEANGTTVNVGLWRGAANAPTTDGNFLNLGGYDGVVLATGAAAIGSQTERLRINSSGNVLINCSRSEYGQLQVSTLPTTAGAYASALGLGFLANACEGASTGISFYTKISLGAGIFENARISTFTDGISSSVYGALAFSTMNATTLSERMRIGNNGFIGVNTTNALSRFDVALQSGESFTIGNCSNTITCGDLIGALTFVSRDASTNSTGGIAGIRSYATQTYNTGGVEGDLRFYTSIVNTQPNGTILSGSEVLKLSQDGVACFCGKICAPTGIFSSRVGIGETSPVSSLVVSTPSDTTSIAQSGIVIQGSSTLTAGCVMALSFVAIPGTTRARAAIGSIVGSDWGKGNLTFYTRDSSDSTALSTADEKMRITSGGLVGIATNSPVSPLHVVCVPSSFFGIIETTGCSVGTVKHFRIHKPGCVEYGIGILDNNAYHISTASTFPTANGFTLTSNGNVGFGECNPGTNKMVILGGSGHDNVFLRLKTDGTHGTKPQIHFDSGLIGINRATKAMIMGGYNSPTGGGGGVMQFYTNDTSENLQQRMCIDPAGQVTIMGALAKGSGSFRICHPLSSKANTHALVHSFIEGPNADLIYSGHAKLINGVACINIDCSARMTQGTFEALNRCVRIFTTNETSWDAVRGKVCGNMVVIESQNNSSEDEISWMVIGERQDQHMFDTEWTDTEGRVITEPEIVIVNDDDIV